MRIDDLNQSAGDRDISRTDKLDRQDPLGSSSMTRGQLRVGGTAVLLVDSEGGVVIHGQLNGDGTITWTGTLTNTGETNLNGPTKIQGTLDVSGITTLLNNLIIGAGGKITAGAVTVDPGAGGTGGLSSASAIRFASPQVFTTADLSVGDDLTVSDVLAVLGVIINNGIQASTNAANVYVNPTTKQLYQVTSSLRFKIDPQPMELPDALLDVPVKDWIDKAAAERYADLLEHPRPLVETEQIEMDDRSSLRRVPGIIAEEVAAAGGEPFVTYDAEGEIQAVAYDRLALARTQILATRLNAALARIEELEKRPTC